MNLKSRFATLSPFALLAIEFNFYRGVFEATSHQVLYMATKVAFTFRSRSPGKTAHTDRGIQSKNPSLKLSGKMTLKSTEFQFL